ncbi:MAG TPA: hypothetical protein VNC50_20930 [Planctomycetia bacterium]|nr:hypothetical protein [Planctomycetia bacterium]
MFAALALVVSTLGATADPPEGEAVTLAIGELFLPKAAPAKPDRLDLHIHLHGKPESLRKTLAARKEPIAVVWIHFPGLSSAYSKPLREPGSFGGVVADVEKALAARERFAKAKLGRIVVSCFSAGYGGVREWLKDPAAYARIDGLVTADSIYAGYAEGKKVDPANMTGFAAFASDAIAGKKAFLLTHCDLQPDGYASTRETADFILAKLKLERAKADEEWAEKWRLTSMASAGKFEVLGFAGTEGDDHVRHLRHVDKLASRLWDRLNPSE